VVWQDGKIGSCFIFTKEVESGVKLQGKEGVSI